MKSLFEIYNPSYRADKALPNITAGDPYNVVDENAVQSNKIMPLASLSIGNDVSNSTRTKTMNKKGLSELMYELNILTGMNKERDSLKSQVNEFSNPEYRDKVRNYPLGSQKLKDVTDFEVDRKLKLAEVQKDIDDYKKRQFDTKLREGYFSNKHKNYGVADLYGNTSQGDLSNGNPGDLQTKQKDLILKFHNDKMNYEKNGLNFEESDLYKSYLRQFQELNLNSGMN